MYKDNQFTSINDDPNMVWSCIKKDSICHKCLNYFTDDKGCEFCDIRCVEPEAMTIEDLEAVQETNECEFYIKKLSVK